MVHLDDLAVLPALHCLAHVAGHGVGEGRGDVLVTEERIHELAVPLVDVALGRGEPHPEDLPEVLVAVPLFELAVVDHQHVLDVVRMVDQEVVLQADLPVHDVAVSLDHLGMHQEVTLAKVAHPGAQLLA